MAIEAGTWCSPNADADNWNSEACKKLRNSGFFDVYSVYVIGENGIGDNGETTYRCYFYNSLTNLAAETVAERFLKPHRGGDNKPEYAFGEPVYTCDTPGLGVKHEKNDSYEDTYNVSPEGMTFSVVDIDWSESDSSFEYLLFPFVDNREELFSDDDGSWWVNSVHVSRSKEKEKECQMSEKKTMVPEAPRVYSISDFEVGDEITLTEYSSIYPYEEIKALCAEVAEDAVSSRLQSVKSHFMEGDTNFTVTRVDPNDDTVYVRSDRSGAWVHVNWVSSIVRDETEREYKVGDKVLLGDNASPHSRQDDPDASSYVSPSMMNEWATVLSVGSDGTLELRARDIFQTVHSDWVTAHRPASDEAKKEEEQYPIEVPDEVEISTEQRSEDNPDPGDSDGFIPLTRMYGN